MACNSCCFSGTKSVYDSKTHSLRRVVPSVTHKLRTVDEMRDTHCHACALNNFVITTRDTVKKIKLIKFSPRHGAHHFTRLASPRIPTHSVTSSSLVGTQIACRGVNRLSCQCEASCRHGLPDKLPTRE